MWLSEDGKNGELQLSHNSNGDWVEIVPLRVDFEMFQQHPISEELKRYIDQFIEGFITSLE